MGGDIGVGIVCLVVVLLVLVACYLAD